MMLEESPFLMMSQTIPETLQIANLNWHDFLQILRFFQNNVSLKNSVQLPLYDVYLFCKNASPKYVENFAKNVCLMYVNRNFSQPCEEILRVLPRYLLFC